MAVGAVALPLIILLVGLWLGLPSLALALVFGVVAMLSIVALALLLLRAARQEASTAAALQEETQRRETAEDALLQSQKMEAIGRLTGGIAHDFNNHLTVINSNIELLKRRMPQGTESLTRFADAAMQGVQRAASLAHRLLNFSRQRPTEPEPTDVGRLVFSMTELLRRTLGETIEVQTKLAATLWPTRIDANQFENVMLNLAVNARDAMPAGSKLVIETANVALGGAAAAEVDVQPGDYVLIAARDADAENPADEFADLPDALTIAELLRSESGLGLSMVQTFARRCGGKVRFDIMPGGSAGIRLYLPRHVEAPPAAPVAITTTAKRDGAEQTVLVVEDDDAVRQTAAEALRDLGYQVLEAPDAMEAIRLIVDRGDIDLLFTDVGLPGGVNGLALADAARNACATLKILFTTGYTKAIAAEFARPEEQAHFLAKPFSLDQLATMVREVLDDTPPRRVAVAAVASVP